MPAAGRYRGRLGRAGRRLVLAGSIVVLAMLLGCVLTLPITLGRAASSDAELGTVPRRYEATNPELALLPPAWMSERPDEQQRIDAYSRRTGDTPTPWLGTDKLGRDMLIRCLAGGGISLGIGLSAAAIAVVIGTLYGALAGAMGGRVDAVLMRIVDVFYGLPYILLVVLLAVAVDGFIDQVDTRVFAAQQLDASAEPPWWLTLLQSNRQLLNVITLLVAIGAVSWLTMARVIRGQVLSLKQQPFMEACRAMGVSRRRQFFRHLLPNLAGPIIVYATLTVPQAILSESFLSFLGIGVREPLPSWGNLAAAGLNELNTVRVRWWLLLWPCLFIGITLLALNFVGEGMRESLDPRRRLGRGAMSDAAKHAPHAQDESLLAIRDLAISFALSAQRRVQAVDGLSLTIHPNQTLALVGESGCGKSVTALSILQLIREPGQVDRGRIFFRGKDLVQLSPKEMLQIRGCRISMIFQEPMTSLNPVYSIGAQIIEAIRLHQNVNRSVATELAIQAMAEVGIPDPPQRLRAYPHQFSGGMRQRVMIAMALACQPSLLLADEPTTALDVTIQEQILQLLSRLKRDRGMGIMLITHDLCVVAQHADVVCVMYGGRVLEYTSVQRLFENPSHPYTRGLLSCIPGVDRRQQRLTTVEDVVSNPEEFRRLPGYRNGIIPWWPDMDAPAELNGAAPDDSYALHELEPGHWVGCWLTKYVKEHPTREPDVRSANDAAVQL